MKNVMKALGYTVLVMFGIAVLFNFFGNRSTAGRVASKKPSEVDYIPAPQMDYRKAALGQYAVGTPMKFTGEILQIVGNTGARMSTKEIGRYEYSGEELIVAFESKPQLIERDIAEVWARYAGTQKYTTVLRAEREVPTFKADYYIHVPTR
jgi:hypothetical protein